MKRIISILLTITMLFCVTGSTFLNVSAVTTDMVESGTYIDQYGEWSYDVSWQGNGYKITGYKIGNMTDIEVPASINGTPVVEISSMRGDYAYCDDLISVTIPASVTIIDPCAFNLYFALTDIHISSDNPNYSSLDGVVFNKTQSEIICCPPGRDSYTIPSGVTAIADFAFYDRMALGRVIIPNSVITIGLGAFDGCWQLRDVIIPNSVTTIEDHAFDGCISLNSITIPESVITIGDFVFYYASNLCEIIVSPNNPNYCSVDGVLFDKKQARLICCPEGAFGFHGDYTIPDSVTSIANSAFYSCDNLYEITIPASVKTIDYGAFGYCDELENVYYEGTQSQWYDIEIDNFGNSNEYLLNANIHFKEYYMGDISGDDVISIKDSLYVLKYLIGDIELLYEQEWAADLNYDGKVTLEDAVMLQKVVLGIKQLYWCY